MCSVRSGSIVCFVLFYVVRVCFASWMCVLCGMRVLVGSCAFCALWLSRLFGVSYVVVLCVCCVCGVLQVFSAFRFCVFLFFVC